MSDPRLIIVGAGAAGIGAALELQARGIPHLVLEAADRVGGRAFTDAAGLPVPWDHGCHWLHCADQNPLVDWADRLGVPYRTEARIDAHAPWLNGGFVGADDIAAADAAIGAAFDTVEQVGHAGRDVAVSEVLPDTGRWNSSVRCILQLMAGDDPEDVSAMGYSDYAETNTNWPVSGGYGTLIARMAEGLNIRLNAPVSAIDQMPDGVRVHLDGTELRAEAAIVTVSTNVLNAGGIRFGPGSAADLLPLVADVPCGAYEKVAIALRKLPPQLEAKLFSMISRDDAPSLNLQVIHGAPPLIVSHIAGDDVRHLLAQGQGALEAHVLAHLDMVFGPAFRDDVIAVAVTDWTANPFVRGSYSHARPGTARARHRMIEADTGNVAFAGEAFSLRWQATAHGAYQSGRDVAARIAAALG